MVLQGLGFRMQCVNIAPETENCNYFSVNRPENFRFSAGIFPKDDL